MGVKVVTCRCDVADPGQVAVMMAQINSAGPRLRGVFHAAGVLDDKPIAAMAKENLVRVMRSKATGAWLLHEHTRGMDLDHFVLFSSISVLVGNSRQANYCAANGFLDALAHHRCLHGLPALSVNWGAIEGVGMLGEDERVGQHLRRIGLMPLPLSTALVGLERAMAKDLAQICIAAPVDWDQWARYEVSGGRSVRFATLVSKGRENREDSAQTRLTAQLAKLEPEDRAEILVALITEVVARTLKIPADQIGGSQPLDAVGVDSLMATEIQLELEKAFGLSIATMALMGDATIVRLAATSLDQLALDDMQTSIAAE
jgi:acyl carrier protein